VAAHIPPIADILETLGKDRAPPAEADQVRVSVPLRRSGVAHQSVTRYDDEIYEHLLKEFPEFGEQHEKLVKLDEEWLKSYNGKERWRNFINQ
jgi:hypothetical protein